MPTPMKIIWKIDPWLNKGMNSDFERATGCYHCHGTILKMKDGKLDPETWPNVGVGRINLDGSKGSCTSCHTRHRFSVMEARKPEACGQCHLGPDHPQIEIYMESKHGDIYTAHGDEYNWNAAPGTWTPGVDYQGTHLRVLPYVRCRHGPDQPRCHRKTGLGNPGASDRYDPGFQTLSGQDQL